MIKLFSDFTNLNTSYSPNNFLLKYPCEGNSKLESSSPNKPYEIIKNNKLIGYFWYQGNSIDLVFDIDGTITMQATDNYLTIEDVFKLLIFEAFLYDFRGIKILEYSNHPLSLQQLLIDFKEGIDGITVTIPISAEISSTIVKGKYKLDLIASHPSGYRETIFSSTQNNGNEDIIFEVK